MIGFFRVVGRVVGWLLRTRALRPVLAFFLFAWVLEGMVATATDVAWFSSVGMEALWRQQFTWSAGVGVLFVVCALVASIPLMRAVARPVAKDSEEPSLPRAMVRWQPLRGRATRLGWLWILVFALVLGRELSLRWSEFALAITPSGTGDGAADFWMYRAPALQSALAAAWTFALGLGVVALVAGVLRALPFLAARPSVVPTRWLRALWIVGMALCLLRALGFGFEALRHAQIANDSSAARIGFVAINALGALGCLAIGVLLRRPKPLLALGVVGVLMVPSLAGDVLAPFVGQSSLEPPAPSGVEVSSRSPNSWPQWDEVTLLRATRLQRSQDAQRHLVDWQRAGIDPTGSRAEVVGTPIQGDQWAGHGLTDREGGITWRSLELPEHGGVPLKPLTTSLFYGLRARPLLNMEARDLGVPFRSWAWKLAWAWRLRNPLLLVEGAQANHLLVVRGTREVGHKLAPFWAWDDVVPRRDSRTGKPYFECVAYSVSSRAPRRAAFEGGTFAGQKSVVPVAVLRVDARSGEVHLMPFASSGSLPLQKRWKQVLPALFGGRAPEYAPTPALEVALADGSSLVWIRTAKGWEKKAVPLEWRDALAQKLDELGDRARANSPSRPEEGTPMIWQQGGELFLAQPFFGHLLANQGHIGTDADALPQITGVAAGPLREHGAQWSATFPGVRAELASPNGAEEPSSTVAPALAPGTRPLRDVALEAREVERAANEAFKKGRYVEAQKQRERLGKLLDELAQRAK